MVCHHPCIWREAETGDGQVRSQHWSWSRRSWVSYVTLLTTTETNVRRVALPADLVARIRAGEQVSAEEITAAQERVAAGETTSTKPVNEWLPANTTKKAPTSRSRRSKKQ